jgi:hypothetical protein
VKEGREGSEGNEGSKGRKVTEGMEGRKEGRKDTVAPFSSSMPMRMREHADNREDACWVLTLAAISAKKDGCYNGYCITDGR